MRIVLLNCALLTSVWGGCWDLPMVEKIPDCDCEPCDNLDNGDVSNNWVEIALPLNAQDVGVGGHNAYIVVSPDELTTDGYVYRYDGTRLNNIGGRAVAVCADNHGNPRIVNSQGEVFAGDPDGNWISLPGSPNDVRAQDIACSVDELFVIGLEPTPYGGYVYRWDGAEWTKIFGEGIRMTYNTVGQPMLANNRGHVFTLDETGAWAGPIDAYTANTDDQHEEARMQDLGGDYAISSLRFRQEGGNIYRLGTDSLWEKLPTDLRARRIDADRYEVWIVSKEGRVYKRSIDN